MYHIKQDKRSRTSAALIWEGMQKCLHRKEFRQVTVTEIVDISGVGKATFYRLFDGKEDVLRLACDRCFDGLLASYREAFSAGSNPGLILYYIRFLQGNRELLKWCIDMERPDLLLEAHRRAIEKYAPCFFPRLEQDSEEFIYFVNMRNGILLGLIHAWLLTEKTVSPDRVETLVMQQIKDFSDKALSSSG